MAIDRYTGPVSFFMGGGGGGAEVSCPNIFSIACPNIQVGLPEYGYLQNSRGGLQPPGPTVPLPPHFTEKDDNSSIPFK